jgi:hypothetical protein
MIGETLYQNTFLEIKSERREQRVEVIRKKMDETDDIQLFHELLDVIIAYIIGLHPKNIIFTLDKINYFVDTEILKTMFFPKIIELGIHTCAFVVGDDVNTQVYYKELLHSLSELIIEHNVDIQVFTDERDVKRWLASRSM